MYKHAYMKAAIVPSVEGRFGTWRICGIGINAGVLVAWMESLLVRCYGCWVVITYQQNASEQDYWHAGDMDSDIDLLSISQCFNLSLTRRKIGLYRIVMISTILECMLVEAVVSSMTKSMSYEEKLPLKIKCHDVYLNKRWSRISSFELKNCDTFAVEGVGVYSTYILQNVPSIMDYPRAVGDDSTELASLWARTSTVRLELGRLGFTWHALYPAQPHIIEAPRPETIE